MGSLFTIGYSGLDMPGFVALLRASAIDVVCDVRSTPYSTYKPDFTRGPFRGHLNAADIKYVFLGGLLGARPRDRSCYVDGQATYERIARTADFAAGLDRVRKGVRSLNLALVCSERDPIECHRAVLVCHHLGDLHDRTTHVHTDGATEDHAAFEARLVAVHGLTPPPLLAAPGDWEVAVTAAYERQSAAIAFREAPRPAPEDTP
jgi:uncharacterized protein (DUF488 family)